MDEKKALEILGDLRAGKIDSHLIMKEEFMVFRNILINQSDRNNFKGFAQKGGKVLYKYQKEE